MDEERWENKVLKANIFCQQCFRMDIVKQEEFVKGKKKQYLSLIEQCFDGDKRQEIYDNCKRCYESRKKKAEDSSHLHSNFKDIGIKDPFNEWG